MQTIKFEVKSFHPDNEKSKERREWYKEFSNDVRRLKNCVMQNWLNRHFKAGSAKKLWKTYDAYRAWVTNPNKKKGTKPKVPKRLMVGVIPSKTWISDVYHDMRDLFPRMSTRVITLTNRKLIKTMSTRKSSNKGELPAWKANLLGLESLMTFSHPQPINFDVGNAYISEEEGEYKIWLKTELPAPYHPVKDILTLVTKDKKAWRQLPLLKKLVAGEAVFKGSQLVYNKGRNKWFVHLVIEVDKGVGDVSSLEPSKISVILPGRKVPWRLRIGDVSYWRGGTGDHVGAMRRKLQNERRSRQNKYRRAPRNTKGRGRNNAIKGWQKLENAWHDYCERYNHETTAKIVKELVRRKVGKLIYLEPKSPRFLSEVGKEPAHQSAWPLFRAKTMLKYKCHRAGIDFFDAASWKKYKEDAAKPVEKKDGDDGLEAKV